MTTFTAIAAICKSNRGLSFEGKMPWKIKEDLRYFRMLTKQTYCLVGSNTFYDDFNGKPLPWRVLFYLSSSFRLDKRPKIERIPQITKEGVAIGLGNVDELPSKLTHVNVIGGAHVYEQMLPKCDTLLLTEIDNDIECDKFFPYFLDDFELVGSIPQEDTSSEYSYNFNIYKRKETL